MRNCLFTNSSLEAIKTTMIFLSFPEIKRNFIFIQELRLELNRILPIWCVLRFTQAYVLETKNDLASLPHGQVYNFWILFWNRIHKHVRVFFLHFPTIERSCMKLGNDTSGETTELLWNKWFSNWNIIAKFSIEKKQRVQVEK